MSNHIIAIYALTILRQNYLSLDRGEKDAILLVIEIKSSVFATDDGKAIKKARFLKTPFIISSKIVIEL
jgi:hypothetical protein